MNKKLLALASFLLAAVVFGYLALLHRGNDNNGGAIRIAANLPMTGELSTYGESVRRGVLLAQDHLEASGEKPLLDFRWGDNAGSPQTAVTIMRRDLLSPPAIYVSGVRPQTFAIWEEVSRADIPHFVWIFEMLINNVTPNKNNFRTWVNLKVEPKVYLDFVKRTKAKRVAIVYCNLPSAADEFNQLVIPGLAELGISGDSLFVEPYEYQRNDFRNIAVKLQEFAPDTLILGGFQVHMVAMVKAFRPAGLITSDNTIASYDMLDAAELLSAEELEGIRVVAPEFVTRPDQEERTKWIKAFRERFGIPPLYTDAYAYDMAMIISNAATRVPESAANADWIKALAATDIDGITGRLRFDEDQSLITPVEAGVFRNRQIVPDDLAAE